MQEKKVYNALKKIRTVGVIVSILLILLGIAMVSVPLLSALFIAYLFIAGIIISGIFGIIKYVKTPNKSEKIWSLVFAILSLVLGVVVLINDVTGGLAGQANAIYMMSVVLAFMLITTGVGRFTASSAMKKAGKKGSGWMICSGILDLLVGIFFLTRPFSTIYTYEWIMGIFVIISGISLLIELLSDPPAKEEKQEK